jgi:hypothetical protein
VLCNYAKLWFNRKDVVKLPPSANNPGNAGGHDEGDYPVPFQSARIGSVSDDEAVILKGVSLFTNYMEFYRTDLYVPSGGSGVTVAHGIDFGQLAFNKIPKSTCKGGPSFCAYSSFLMELPCLQALKR